MLMRKEKGKGSAGLRAMECDMRVVFRVAHGGGKKKRVKYKEEDTGAPGLAS